MTNEEPPLTPEEARRHSPERIPAFVDATFAIIMTILVLEIGVPSDLTEQSLREALEEVGPTLIAWVISFLLVGMYWVWHRDLFNKVRYVNRDVVWLNIVFLLPVSLVPVVFYAVAMIVADAAHQLSLALYLLVPGSYFVLVTILRDRPATAGEADDFS